MPIIDLNQLPAPDVVEELDFETILAERKATLISLYPEDQQEALSSNCWRKMLIVSLSGVSV